MGGVESGVKHVGGPDGAWGASPREAPPHGRVRTARASDPRSVLGDGRAVHTGKGRTGRRSLHRQHGPTRKDRPPRPPSLQGRAPKAARPQGDRFRTRDGLRDEACLKPCWRASRQAAASGVEQGSAQDDAPPLDAHLHGLVERLKPKRSRATRVRRPSLPTGDGTQRPGGLPAVEATRLPRAVARLLDALDAQDCRRWRSGSRPPGGALEAVDPRTITRPGGREAWVVEADLTQCVETIEHDGMVRRVAARREDGARRRVMRQGLQAGVLDPAGPVRHPATGTPQGHRH